MSTNHGVHLDGTGKPIVGDILLSFLPPVFISFFFGGGGGDLHFQQMEIITSEKIKSITNIILYSYMDKSSAFFSLVPPPISLSSDLTRSCWGIDTFILMTYNLLHYNTDCGLVPLYFVY